VQLTRQELVQVFSALEAIDQDDRYPADPELIAFRHGIKEKLAQAQANGPVPICEVHQLPLVRMKGKHGPFWSCHQKDENGEWCQYRPA
jgi:hypothetical protein